MAKIYWPTDLSRVTEWCGTYSSVRSGIHKGTDFAFAQGSDLRATTDGTIRVYSDTGGGAGIDITNSDGIVIRNWHISEFLVSNGDYVTAGQVIGRTGGAPGTWGAGNSTGPHLHWELRDNANWGVAGWIDPRGLTIYSFDGSEVSAGGSSSTVGAQGEGVRGSGSDWTYWVPGTNDQMTVQSRLKEKGFYGGAIDGNLASDESVRALKLACGHLGYFDLNYWDGAINKNLCYGILLLAQNHGGYSGWNNLYTDGHVWAAFDSGVASAIATPAPPAPPVEEKPAETVVETPKVEEEVAKVEPEVVSTPEEKEEKPVVKEPTPEEIAASSAKLAAMSATIKPADLGNIITDNKVRKIVWAVYGLLGLGVLAAVGGMQAASWLSPDWFLFIMGAYTALGPAFSSLAVANISTKSE